MNYKCKIDNDYAKSGDVVKVEFIYSNPDYLPANHIPMCVLNGKYITNVEYLTEHFIEIKEHREDVIKKII